MKIKSIAECSYIKPGNLSSKPIFGLLRLAVWDRFYVAGHLLECVKLYGKFINISET